MSDYAGETRDIIKSIRETAEVMKENGVREAEFNLVFQKGFSQITLKR